MYVNENVVKNSCGKVLSNKSKHKIVNNLFKRGYKIINFKQM